MKLLSKFRYVKLKSLMNWVQYKQTKTLKLDVIYRIGRERNDEWKKKANGERETGEERLNEQASRGKNRKVQNSLSRTRFVS